MDVVLYRHEQHFCSQKADLGDKECHRLSHSCKFAILTNCDRDVFWHHLHGVWQAVLAIVLLSVLYDQ